jgi:hypothetical protein
VGILYNEGGIKMTGGLGMRLSGRAFVASPEEFRKRLDDWKSILFVSALTTWTKSGLVPTDTTV